MPLGPACRYPDPITHDMVAPSGTTVPLPAGPDPQPTLIEALPAAHLMHGVACTGVITGGIVHPPPPAPLPIVLGSPTVFIRHMPAARWIPSLDTGACGVFLGNPALAATRTTIIGDGGGGGAGGVAPLPIKMINVNGQWVMQVGTSIFIYPAAGDPDFQGKAAEAYQRLYQLSPNMQRAIGALQGSGHGLAVVKYNGALGPFNATTTPHNMNDAMPNGTVSTIGGTTYTGTGRGTDSTIAWDPDTHGNGIPPGTPGSDQQGSDVILAHETIHGVHNATGQHDPGIIVPDGTNTQTTEERNTVGLPAQVYSGAAGDPNNGTALPDTTGQPYTENGVRNDYRAAGVNAPVAPVNPLNPPPPAPAPPRPSYYPNAAGQPF